MDTNYELRTGYDNMDVKAIYHFLSTQSYWAKNIPYETVDTAMSHSYCVGMFHKGNQIAFARAVTDYSVFGWICDVYVLPEYRGQGISKAIMSHLMEQDWMKKLRRCALGTLDAHGLYAQFDFKTPQYPDRLMEITRKDMYTNNINNERF